jgi:hypothetical protein
LEPREREIVEQVQGNEREAEGAGTIPRTHGRRPPLNGLDAVGQGVQLGKREQRKPAQGDGQRHEQAGELRGDRVIRLPDGGLAARVVI